MPIFVVNMVKEVRHDNSCRFRLYPNKEQRELVAKTFGCCRWVYNWRLSMRKKAWEEKKSLSITDIQSRLPAMKKDAATSWLKEVDAKALIFSLRCMDTAYQNFFKHQSGFPRFKAKYDRNQSYQTYQDVSFFYDKANYICLKCKKVSNVYLVERLREKSRLAPLIVILLVNTMLVLL